MEILKINHNNRIKINKILLNRVLMNKYLKSLLAIKRKITFVDTVDRN